MKNHRKRIFQQTQLNFKNIQTLCVHTTIEQIKLINIKSGLLIIILYSVMNYDRKKNVENVKNLIVY